MLNLALFLTNFLSAHVTILETPSHRDVLLNAHLYLIKISQVEEREIFKICLEYWAKLVADLYDEMQKFPGGELAAANPLLNLGGFGGPGASGAQPGRRGIYTEVLSNLRLVMVERMAKPEEVREKRESALSFGKPRSPRTPLATHSGPHRRERRGRDRSRVPQGHGHGRALQEYARGPRLPHPLGCRRHRDDQCVLFPLLERLGLPSPSHALIQDRVFPFSDGKVVEAGRRVRVVLGELEHALLGYRIHLGRDERGDGEALPRHRHQGCVLAA